MNISSPDWVDDTTVRYEHRVGDSIQVWYGKATPLPPGANYYISVTGYINGLPAMIRRSPLSNLYDTGEHIIKWEPEPREEYRVVPAASTEEKLRTALREVESIVMSRNISLRPDHSDSDYFQEIGSIVSAALGRVAG
jgi:hypothetical protein